MSRGLLVGVTVAVEVGLGSGGSAQPATGPGPAWSLPARATLGLPDRLHTNGRLGVARRVGRQHVVPEGFDVAPQRLESVRRRLVVTARAVSVVGHELGVAQHAEVLRGRGLPDLHSLGELADCAGSLPQRLEHRAACRVGECDEGIYIGHDLYSYPRSQERQEPPTDLQPPLRRRRLRTNAQRAPSPRAPARSRR